MAKFSFSRTQRGNVDSGTLVTLGIWEENSFSFPTRSHSQNFPYYRSTNAKRGNSVLENYIPSFALRYHDNYVEKGVEWEKKKKKKNWNLAAINARPSDKSKSKVGQELYRADNRRVV